MSYSATVAMNRLHSFRMETHSKPVHAVEHLWQSLWQFAIIAL